MKMERVQAWATIAVLLGAGLVAGPGLRSLAAPARPEPEAVVAAARPGARPLPRLRAVGALDLSYRVDRLVAAEGLALGVAGGCTIVPGQLTPTCEGQLLVIDVARPGAPALVGSWAVEAPQETIADLALAGRLAYVVVQRHSPRGDPQHPAERIEVLDLMDPAAPRPLATIQEESPLVHAALGLRGDYLYWLRNGDATAAGLSIYSVARPAAPELKGTRPIAGNGLAFQGELMVVSHTGPYFGGEAEDALRVFDLSEPTTPVLRSMAPGDFIAVEATADRIYAEARRACFEGPQPVPCGSYLVEHQVFGAGARIEALWQGFQRPMNYSGMDHLGAELLIAQDNVFARSKGGGEPVQVLNSDDMVALDPRGGFAADVAVMDELVLLPVLTSADPRARIVVARRTESWPCYLPQVMQSR
jgi:hypothetical protein